MNTVNIAAFVLRLAVGGTMIAHGWNHAFGGGKRPGTARWFESIGIRPGRVHALAAPVTELGAGALLVLGRPPSRPTSPAFRRAAPMQRIQIKVKRPHPTSLPDLDLRTPSGRQLPY